MSRYHGRGSHGRVVQSLGEGIVSGEFPPGVTIDIDGLEARFGVSRTVIREAVKVLASKGLLESRQRRGTFVRPQSEWNRLDPDVLRWRFEFSQSVELFDQLHEAREMIEPQSVRWAAERRTAHDVEAAAEALSRMSEAVKSGDVSAFVDADVAFHTALLDASQNELVGSFAMMIELGLEVRDALIHERKAPSQADIARHLQVLNAVIARDGDRAESSMRALLTQAGRLMSKHRT